MYSNNLKISSLEFNFGYIFFCTFKNSIQPIIYLEDFFKFLHSSQFLQIPWIYHFSTFEIFQFSQILLMNICITLHSWISPISSGYFSIFKSSLMILYELILILKISSWPSPKSFNLSTVFEWWQLKLAPKPISSIEEKLSYVNNSRHVQIIPLEQTIYNSKYHLRQLRHSFEYNFAVWFRERFW